jgi:hypothetical protein
VEHIKEMTDMIELGKKYQTRDGRAVRILATDRDCAWPIVGLIRDKNGDECIGQWRENGQFYRDEATPSDLVAVPTKHEGWIIISRDLNPAIISQIVYRTEQEAEVWRINSRYAAAYMVIPITWET